jgi:NitT/TauT family transport system substrate-binding protein
MNRTTALVMMFLSVLLLGCRSEPRESVKPLKIGLVTWVGYGPLYVAQEKGFFREQGLNVDLQRIEGDVERRAAIASGQLDAIALTLDSMIVLRAHGIRLKTVMAIDASNGGDGIVVVPAIKTVEELKGKQIAFPTGLPSHFFLYTVLKQHGMQMSDIKPIVMDADQAGAAFASGKIDAAVTWEPWLSKASEIGRGHVLANSKQFPETIEDVLFMREDVLSRRQDAVAGLVKAWYKAVDYVAANPVESKAIMAKAFGLPADKVDKLMAGIRYEGRDGNRAAFGTEQKPGFLYPMYDRISDAWIAEHVITARDKGTDGIDASFVRHSE